VWGQCQCVCDLAASPAWAHLGGRAPLAHVPLQLADILQAQAQILLHAAGAAPRGASQPAGNSLGGVQLTHQAWEHAVHSGSTADSPGLGACGTLGQHS